MKKLQYTVVMALCLLCFCSFVLMIRECENLNQFQFMFLWGTMSLSALLGLLLLKNMEGK